MKYKKLKEYLNSLSEDQLNQDVIVVEKTGKFSFDRGLGDFTK
jgi:hypothetical protein